MKREPSAGFTLVEVIVATTVSLLLTGLAIHGAVYCWRVVRTVSLTNEMKQNVRMSLDLVARDVRGAGYGLDVPAGHLPLWIDWIANFTENPQVVQGSGGAPDTLRAAGVYETAPKLLSASASAGDTTLHLVSGGDHFNTVTRKVLFVGRAETARVVSRSGNTLTISTHPTSSSGLQFDHPAGAPVELVQVMTTAWAPDSGGYPNQSHLQRTLSGETYTYAWQRFATGHIEDFQVDVTNGVYTVTITGRTSREEHGFTHAGHNDGYRRLTLQSALRSRN